ncbi:2-hydroxyacid dehydrogenase [Bacteroidota bacterium]
MSKFLVTTFKNSGSGILLIKYLAKPIINMSNKNSNKKVFISRIFPEIGINLLKEAGFSVTQWKEDRSLTQDELIRKLKDHHALFCTGSENIDKKFLNACRHLDIISQFAAGYDNIDVDEATRLGIPIGYSPGAMSEATADIAFALMLVVSRKMFFMHQSIKNGDWGYFRPNANLGIELKNKILGIFGLGRIGTEMAKRCKNAYNMKILYHNRTRNLISERELGAQFVTFEKLLERSDVISVHCTLNESTKEIFNKKAFAKMKSMSIFINTSRGLVHNEKDLIDALKTGKIWGAGLDVTNPEPMTPDNELLRMENVAVLPHIGSATIEARNKMTEIAARNIIEFYQDKKVTHLVNSEVLKNQ